MEGATAREVLRAIVRSCDGILGSVARTIPELCYGDSVHVLRGPVNRVNRAFCHKVRLHAGVESCTESSCERGRFLTVHTTGTSPGNLLVGNRKLVRVTHRSL
jgi:hypothetical protein